jgi:hypothetical protein
MDVGPTCAKMVQVNLDNVGSRDLPVINVLCLRRLP